ncbi:16S rRNA (uracil(1498)-N(3))-methyltransferase [Spongiibacter nanhainus]|uniref:Ribosomal RNA small subunit methyltransferase E n=1 Tax=Spongiibacter nanhainus TaxID=2794344 RepID=A0A7T4UNU3_9GAMM|nr:16S rRNA (uracil(1498)-N(3))-methyltransferase [Spongiibacter nanhainus]QQD16968.1 16S rRNA (uracil(1498)-N(3))-methyltransferase [Spongiibacter nanhainus]
MNRVLFNAQDFVTSDRVRLCDYRADHIRRILRAAPGDCLKVGLINDRCGSGEVLEINQSSVTLRVTLDQAPPPKRPVTLLLALPRPKMARRIVHAATELGVKKIILLNSYRVEKSFWQSPLVDDTHLFSAMVEGLAQCGDTILPTLQRARLFKPFVEDELPTLLSQRTGLVAHPYASSAFTKPSGETVLAIGPEGGFIPYEVEKLLEAGMQGFTLGPRILKVETAVPAILGQFC